jgi:uncharacterized membrane protein YeaQ/YmgE (transglycosylase-associated protein family)
MRFAMFVTRVLGGLLAGVLAGLVVKRGGYGLKKNITRGLVGSIGGSWICAARRTAASARSSHTLFVQGDLMSRYVAPAFLKRTRRHARLVLGGLILALVWASSTGAQEQPILRFEGRVTYVSPTEMLVALDSGGVVMLDLARIPQSESRQIAQNHYVTVIGFIRRPSHRIIATSIQRASPWVPTTPSWAPLNP